MKTKGMQIKRVPEWVHQGYRELKVLQHGERVCTINGLMLEALENYLPIAYANRGEDIGLLPDAPNTASKAAEAVKMPEEALRSLGQPTRQVSPPDTWPHDHTKGMLIREVPEWVHNGYRKLKGLLQGKEVVTINGLMLEALANYLPIAYVRRGKTYGPMKGEETKPEGRPDNSQNNPVKTERLTNDDLHFTHDNWITYYVLCREYLKKFQKFPSSDVTIDEKFIGKWLEKQLQDWRSGRLSLEDSSRIDCLNELARRYSSKRGNGGVT